MGSSHAVPFSCEPSGWGMVGGFYLYVASCASCGVLGHAYSFQYADTFDFWETSRGKGWICPILGPVLDWWIGGGRGLSRAGVVECGSKSDRPSQSNPGDRGS